MDNINILRLKGALQLPQPDGSVSGQPTPELIRRTSRLPAQHIGDPPSATERRFEPPGAFSCPRPQHSQLLSAQPGRTGLPDGISRWKHARMNHGSGKPGCMGSRRQLTHAHGKQQAMTAQRAVGKIFDPAQQ